MLKYKDPKAEIRKRGFFMSKIDLASERKKTTLPERVYGLRARVRSRAFYLGYLFLPQNRLLEAFSPSNRWLAIPKAPIIYLGRFLISLFSNSYKTFTKSSQNPTFTPSFALKIKSLQNHYVIVILLAWLCFIPKFAYAEIGIASFYGNSEKLNKHTANGEVFDPEKYTAATYKYPFNTILKVTNLKNKKSVIVRVNDRGPNKRLGRTIDLTKKAFSDIADLKEGLIEVEIKSLMRPVNTHRPYSPFQTISGKTGR